MSNVATGLRYAREYLYYRVGPLGKWQALRPAHIEAKGKHNKVDDDSICTIDRVARLPEAGSHHLAHATARAEHSAPLDSMDDRDRVLLDAHNDSSHVDPTMLAT